MSGVRSDWIATSKNATRSAAFPLGGDQLSVAGLWAARAGRCRACSQAGLIDLPIPSFVA
jgi:hypothetical protein